MSYRLPLSTTDDPGVSTVGSGQTLDVRSEVITGSLNVTNRSLIIFLA